MRLRKNIPLIGVAVFAAGGVAALVVLQPSREERLQAAVRKYAESRGRVLDVQMHGTVADILLADDAGKPKGALFVEFSDKGGEWAPGKDLSEDYLRTARDPAVERGVLERMAQRLAGRYGADTVKIPEGLRTQLLLERDPQGALAGRFAVLFQVGGRSARYLETFRYKDGRWASEGAGQYIERTTP